MNKEQFEGSWKQFKGELKKQWGQFTDNDLLEAEGDYDKFLGVVQKRYGDKREEVERWAMDWYSKRECDEVAAKKATESRNQM
ncbi:MAG TPA: CsbD family protein [Candidatus Binatia bacterium]